MTPSAVSQQMSVLEREAGVPLLERQGRGVRLTEAGRALVANTERILAAMEQAEAELAAASQGVVGRVRVSAFPTAARSILIPAIVRLREEHPNLQLSMVDLEPEEAMPALKARELDLVVTYEWDLLPTLEDPGIEREELLTEQVFVTLPKDHHLAKRKGPVAVAELSDEEWIVGRDATSMLELVTAAGRAAGYRPKTDFHSMDFEVILAAVEAGLGVALVPPLALVGETADVVTCVPTDLDLSRSTWAAMRRGSGANPGIAVVLKALRAVADEVSESLPHPGEDGRS